MDLLSLIEVCSVARDSTLVLAMALTFSQGNPYTVKDTRLGAYEALGAGELSAPQNRAAGNREEAIAAVRWMAAHGGSPVMGLLPAAGEWAAEFGRPVEDLLEPCSGLAITTAVVADLEYQCEPKTTWACVLRGYARKAGLELFDHHVLATLREGGFKRDAHVQIETRALLEASPLVATSTARGWGPDHLFISAAAHKKEAVASAAAQESSAAQSTLAAESEPPIAGRKLDGVAGRRVRGRSASVSSGARQKSAPLPELPAQLDRLPVAPLPPRPDFSRDVRAKH